MTEQRDYHVHPRNPNAIIYGRRLQAGDVLREDDVYDSTAGQWEMCICPGLTLSKGCKAYWVRREIE